MEEKNTISTKEELGLENHINYQTDSIKRDDRGLFPTYLIGLQRYNRARIYNILERKEKRKENC